VYKFYSYLGGGYNNRIQLLLEAGWTPVRRDSTSDCNSTSNSSRMVVESKSNRNCNHRLTLCSHLPTFFGDDKSFCRRAVNQNTQSGRVLGGWAWLTSVTPAVIGRPSKNVGHSLARCRRQISASFYGVGDFSASGTGG